MHKSPSSSKSARHLFSWLFHTYRQACSNLSNPSKAHQARQRIRQSTFRLPKQRQRSRHRKPAQDLTNLSSKAAVSTLTAPKKQHSAALSKATLATPAKAPLIEIKHLNHHYGKGALRKQILFDINLSIYPGEIVILTGPSGSGKTTLLTLIGALRSLDEGSLKVLGQELQGANAKARTQVRREIGFVFQAHNLLPFMTARQNVRMALELSSSAPKQTLSRRVDRTLEKVGLGEQLNSYPEKLSGGQKQRVAIARALVSEPKLVLADEPTASLDSKSGRDVVQIMQTLAKEQHCAILLVTHDNRILDVADRIIRIENGTLSTETKQPKQALPLLRPSPHNVESAKFPPKPRFSVSSKTSI